jgi:DNA-3-methyladenine glycosylase I
MLRYHDEEWGVPVHDDRKHFEFLILEGAQAGLSWTTILNKREGYRAAYRGFEPAAVARFTDRSAARLLGDPRIVRNRLKILLDQQRAVLPGRAEGSAPSTATCGASWMESPWSTAGPGFPRSRPAPRCPTGSART